MSAISLNIRVTFYKPITLTYQNNPI